MKASVEMGRALRKSTWILPLLSLKERREKGGEEPGMLRAGLVPPKGYNPCILGHLHGLIPAGGSFPLTSLGKHSLLPAFAGNEALDTQDQRKNLWQKTRSLFLKAEPIPKSSWDFSQLKSKLGAFGSGSSGVPNPFSQGMCRAKAELPMNSSSWSCFISLENTPGLVWFSQNSLEKLEKPYEGYPDRAARTG